MNPEHRCKMPRLALAVNLLWAGCTTPEPATGLTMPTGAFRGPFADRPLQPLRSLPRERRLAGRLSELPALPAAPEAGTLVLDHLTSPVTGAHFEEDLGERLTEALEAADEDGANVDRYGPGVLDTYDLFGDDFHAALCEMPQLT